MSAILKVYYNDGSTDTLKFPTATEAHERQALLWEQNVESTVFTAS